MWSANENLLKFFTADPSKTADKASYEDKIKLLAVTIEEASTKLAKAKEIPRQYLIMVITMYFVGLALILFNWIVYRSPYIFGYVMLYLMASGSGLFSVAGDDVGTIQGYEKQMGDFNLEITKLQQQLSDTKLSPEVLRGTNWFNKEQVDASLKMFETAQKLLDEMKQVDKKWKEEVVSKYAHIFFTFVLLFTFIHGSWGIMAVVNRIDRLMSWY